MIRRKGKIVHGPSLKLASMDRTGSTVDVSDTARQLWTYNKSTKSTIIGMSTAHDHYLDLGLDSEDLESPTTGKC